jgi:hypothetical protein
MGSGGSFIQPSSNFHGSMAIPQNNHHLVNQSLKPKMMVNNMQTGQ